MDSKYGRIWTDADVRSLLEALQGANRDYVEVMLEHLDHVATKFPTHEPLFVLRAKDNFAPHVLKEYRKRGQLFGGAKEFLASVNEAIKDFKEWREANPDLCKVPD